MSIYQQSIKFAGNVGDFLIRNKDTINKNAIPVTVTGILGVQTTVDVSTANKEDKKNVFINNLVIGAAMLAGGMGTHSYVKNLPKLKNHPLKDYFEALSTPIGAGIAGGVAGEIAQRLFPVKNDKRHNILHKAGFFEDIDYESINNVYNNFDSIGATKSLDGTLSTIVGYSIGKEHGIKKKIKKFVHEIIGGILVPSLIIIPLTSRLNKILPDYKKVKAVLVLAAGIGSSMIGKAVGTWINDKITHKVVENQVWDDLSIKQKELLKKAMFTNNPIEKMHLLEKINKLKTVKSKIKNKLA